MTRLLSTLTALGLTSLGYCSLVAQNAEAQAFDCRNAVLASERSICGNDKLRHLDERVDRLYRDLMQQSRGERQREDLRDYQLQFLSARDACGRNASCIKGAYLDQIEALSAELRRLD